MKKIFLLLTMITITSLSLSAQNTKWTWKQYGLSFTAPSSMKVTTNDAVSFAAESNDLHISIEVMDYEGISPETMAAALGQAAGELGMASDSEIGELGLTTLEGIYIDGLVDGIPTTLVLLYDTESNIALLSSLVYSEEYIQKATDVVNSFEIK